MRLDLKLVRQRLESQLRETQSTKELRELIRIHQAADPIDMTQQAAERELAVHRLDRESTRAQRVRLAIERLNGGSYGICLQCEEEIAPKRLNAIPWAELCIECQEKADVSTGRREVALFFNDRPEAA
jgi:DnaK suppressor protein